MIGAFFKAKGMDEAQQKSIDEKLRELHAIDEKQWQEIDAGKEWEKKHEREEANTRLEVELKISKLDGVVGKLDGKLDSINSKLDELIKDVKKKND